MDMYVCPVCREKEAFVKGAGDADASSMPLQERHWTELRRIVISLQVSGTRCHRLPTQPSIPPGSVDGQ